LYCNDNSLTILDISNNTFLYNLHCNDNQLTNLDVSYNTALGELNCGANQLTTLDVSNNTDLIELECVSNQLTSLDVSQNTALTSLQCGSNQLTTLDVSNNTALQLFMCHNDNLTSLDVRNGNNANFSLFCCSSNPNLTCINVDNVAWSTANWTVANVVPPPYVIPGIDPQHYFSNNCPPPSAIQEHSTNKELLKVTDLLGRETKQTNQPLFYIYDDGTVEKRIVIE